MIIEFFVYGIILGAVLTFVIQKARNSFIEYNKFVRPLLKFIKSPLSNYSFIQRTNYFVQLSYQKYVIYLDLNKQEINIFDDQENLIVFRTKSNGKLIEHLYERFVNGFDKEINKDVVNINGVIVSPHLIPKDIAEEESINIETYEYIPTVDEILDKINRLGIENLTKQELEILRNKSKD